MGTQVSIFHLLKKKCFDLSYIDIEKGFLPYLLKKIERSMDKIMLGRIMTDSKLEK